MARWSDVTFGWVLSAGIHVVVLLGAGLFCIEQLASFDDDGGLRIGMRSMLLMEGDGIIPRDPDRFLYGRFSVFQQQRDKSELFDKDGSSLVWTCNDYVFGTEDPLGTGCDYCYVCGSRCLTPWIDSWDNLFGFRSRPSFAQATVETARRCRNLSPLPLKAGDLALLSLLGGMNALPLGISSIR